MLKESFVDVAPEYFDDKFSSHDIEVGRQRLHYTDWNPGGTRTIVLVHGLNVQSHTWDPIADDLAEDFRVICPDLRGHGDSGPGSDYWMRSFVADVNGLVDHLGLPSFVLVGHSLGAKVALSYAGTYPDRVERLVLSDTGPELSKSASKFTQNVLATSGEVKGFRNEAEAMDHFRTANPEWREVFIRLHARHQLRKNWAGKLVPKVDPDVFWLTGSAGRVDDPFVWEQTAKVQAPTLVLWAERSIFFDDDLAERMLATLPNGTLERVMDSGHFIPRERPEALVAAIRRFIADDA
jgi:pimeloyl-ACP methyl ester carboxylesterase